MNKLVEKIDGFPLVLSQVVTLLGERKMTNREVYKELLENEDRLIELSHVKEQTVKRIVEIALEKLSNNDPIDRIFQKMLLMLTFTEHTRIDRNFVKVIAFVNFFYKQHMRFE